MSWITRFLLWLGSWTAGLLIVFVALSVPGASLPDALAGLPLWMSRALALAAFPAGLAVSRDVLPDDAFSWPSVAAMTLLLSALVFGSFLLANYIGPALQSHPAAGADPLTTGHLLFGEFRAYVRAAVETARAQPRAATVDHWFVANALVWQYDSRVAGSILPFLFGWIGALAGFWIRFVHRSDMRQLQYWALGLLLVMSTYLAGENSFELIVVRAAGPVFFSGLFVLFVPTILFGGLAWPAALFIWHREGQRA